MSLRQRRYSELNEAAQVKLKDLEPANRKKVKAIQTSTGGKPAYFHSGMMGEIATFRSARTRFDFDILKKLVSLKIRWFEARPRDKEFDVGL